MKDQKNKPAKCYNCKFGGNQFKIAGTTHLHCHNNEKFPAEKMRSGEISVWDTLMEWYCSCKLHQPKKSRITMKDEIVKVIAEYLEEETEHAGTHDGEFVKFGRTINTAHFTHAGFCQEIAAEIAEKILPIVGEKDLPFDELFDHMANEHGLTLTDTELGDIIHIARGK